MSIPPPPQKPDDHHLMGITYALGTACFLATMNLFAKLLGPEHGPIDITVWRNLIALVMLAGFLILVKRRFDFYKTGRLKAHIIRATIGTVGMVFSIWTYLLLPLAEATALIFTAPLFVVLLSWPLLREKVGIWRIIAVLIGFSGVFVMAGPSGDISTKGLIVGLIAGLGNGAVAICLRWLGQTENTETTVFYFLFIGLIVTVPFMPWVGAMPAFDSSALLFGLGFFGLLSLLTKTYSFRLGAAALISMISFTQIVWAVLFDYLFWDKMPSLPVILGASIIIASNVLIVWREQARKNAP